MKTRLTLITAMVIVLGLSVYGTYAFQGPPEVLEFARGNGPGPQFQASGPLAGARFASDWRRHRGPGRRWRRLREKLNLTDEQKSKMRQIYAGYLNTTRKARISKLALKDEKKAMIISGKIDSKKLADIDDQLVKYKSEVLKARLKMRRDRLALFTPEQIAVLGDFLSKRGMHFKFRRHFRRGRF